MTSEQFPRGRRTAAAVVWPFIGGFVATLVLMFLGLMLGGGITNSVPVAVLSTIVVGSLPIVLGAMNGSRPIVAGGVTAFAIVLAVVGGCFMMLS
jgi:hypothetical protein